MTGIDGGRRKKGASVTWVVCTRMSGSLTGKVSLIARARKYLMNLHGDNQAKSYFNFLTFPRVAGTI